MNNYNYPYFTQQQNYPQISRPTYVENNYPVIKGRPVASIDEARASMIDFDGSVFYFPDTAHSKIYTKQINMDGTSSLRVYELVEAPAAPPAQETELVSKEEFNQTIEQLLLEINNLKNQKNEKTTQPADFKF